MTVPAQWPVARLRQIGSGVWILAAVVTTAGSFMPLLTFNTNFGDGGARPSMSYTLWGADNRGFEMFPMFGVPVIVGAVLLLAAGLLGLMSTRLHPASGSVLAARLIGTGGAGVLAGSLTVVFLFLQVFESVDDDGASRVNNGIGAWMLIAAAIIALIAVVLMLVPKLAKRGEEPETPAMGIPVIRVLEPEYEEEKADAEQPATDPKG
ncbi:hypothetical protein [Kibdelosporangium phytohabitans]|uniref:Uncharacterized protein n=1 Tax=Kibdelosporangium phytohabitans TaxID=860235 RepID=A0A0N9IDE5_9PSEU|nr:hypothetical protein [Kibdelosporangium phytohabitans]ALG12752.1 hypothetical protein AOZ06_43130 [Kibdelosporangium phytohabitans]MBE1464426.1 hypothetical protein [Kibdelosporangium phytohabitans]